MDFDFVSGVSLNAAERFQAAAAASAPNRVAGICDELKLFQDKARHHDGSFQHIALDQVGDASVNDDAGVEHEQTFRSAL